MIEYCNDGEIIASRDAYHKLRENYSFEVKNFPNGHIYFSLIGRASHFHPELVALALVTIHFYFIFEFIFLILFYLII